MSLPGHYPSEFPRGFQPADLTPELIADITAEAIQQLAGDQPVILVGHSTGGFAALAVSARHPQRVKAAVCISGFARGYWTGVLRLLQMQARAGAVGQALFKMNMSFFNSSPALYKASTRFYAADKKAMYGFPAFDSHVQHMYAHAARLDLDAMLAFFNRMPDIDITSWLPQIQAQTLVAAGDRDMIVPTQQARLIARQVPHSTLHFLKGTGHLPMVERAAEYTEVIDRWIISRL